MKKLFIFLLIICVVLLGSTFQSSKETIIIYTPMEKFRTDALQQQLNEKFPNLNVRVMYVSTGKTAARVDIEKESNDADIIVGLDLAYLTKIKDELADISGYSKVPYFAEFSPNKFDNKFVIWERAGGSIIVNTKVLNKYNLPMPTSYEDLLNPIYKGKITMADPKSSGSGYFFYKSLVNIMGEQEALAYFDKFEKNIKQFSESGSGPIKLLRQEEAAVGLGLTFQAVNEINDGMPFKIIYPKEGSPYNLTGTSLMKKSQDNQHVHEVFDFIVNDFIYYDKEHFTPELIYEGQKIKIPNYPQQIHYADMEGISDMEEKERLLEKWKF